MVGVSLDHSHVTDHFGHEETRDECRVVGIPIVNGFATPNWSSEKASAPIEMGWAFFIKRLHTNSEVLGARALAERSGFKREL